MATPRKSDEKYPGYLEDQNRRPFTPTAREEELLAHTVHPDEFKEIMKEIDDRLETLEVRFNELCNMLSVHLANSSFKLLEIRDAEK